MPTDTFHLDGWHQDGDIHSLYRDGEEIARVIPYRSSGYSVEVVDRWKPGVFHDGGTLFARLERAMEETEKWAERS